MAFLHPIYSLDKMSKHQWDSFFCNKWLEQEQRAVKLEVEPLGSSILAVLGRSEKRLLYQAELVARYFAVQ